MSFVRFGKNITSASKAIIWFVVAGGLMLGCSKSDTPKQPDSSTSPATTPENPRLVLRKDATLKDTIEYTINKTFTLVKYGDKSGFFENEFSYITDGKTFDDYLKYGEVSTAKVESLTVIDVLEIVPYGHDSLKASVKVNFLGPSGIPSSINDRITFYYQDGRWIKPMVGKLWYQQEYLKRMRAADSAADAEG